MERANKNRSGQKTGTERKENMNTRGRDQELKNDQQQELKTNQNGKKDLQDRSSTR